jgi:ABC-type multidrug transport system ATPase subunit
VIARGRLVGEGTPLELGARLGRRQRVVLRVEGPADDVAMALAAIPGVERVERAAGRFLLEGPADGDAARAAGEAMQRRGWAIRELREETPDLEDVFLQLVADGQGRP